jgi:RNA polymerase sigma factor (sigma-70 family)
MNAARPAHILRQLERADGAPGTDAELLVRFVATKDADTFAELVRRHGPLVMGVCRRVTGQAQDAEDAFQATFLVLAKKAAVLRTPELLGNYLYGVAFRVAWRAKRSALRRRTREVAVSALPDPPAPSPPPAMPELLPILDEELAALPACYREAIVLCDLRGASREAAATALGIPEGTLSSRLANGRQKLAARLTRRGVTLSAAALPLVLAEARARAAQTVSDDLITKTCGLVADWAVGGTVPAPLARLATGGVNVRTILMLGAVMVVSVAGAVLAANPRDGAPPVDPPKPPVAVAAKPDANPQPKGEPKAADKPAVAYATTPRMLRAFDTPLTGYPTAMWNATGTHLALSGAEISPQLGFVAPGQQPQVATVPAIRLFPLDGKEKGRPAYPGSGATLAAVQPDGSGIVTDLREYSLISGNHQLKFWTSNRPGSGESHVTKVVDLELPEAHGYAFSTDMKTFRTVAWERAPSGGIAKLEALEVDTATGKSIKSLVKLDYGQYVMSANGKRLAIFDKEFTKVTVYDLDRGAKQSETNLLGEKLAELLGIIRNTSFGSVGIEVQPAPTMVLSPNGSRLVVARVIGQSVVINTDTGEALPALEGIKDARTDPEACAFTSDGRLLAMRGTNYKQTKRRLGPGSAKAPEQMLWEPGASFLTVWDTQTGKALKTWNRSPHVAFNPARPLLAILESNGESTRVGFWDFAAEVEKK